MNKKEVIERLQNDLNGDEMLGTDVAICYKDDLKFMLDLVSNQNKLIHKLAKELTVYYDETEENIIKKIGEE